ncbi:transporter substrate-binding domain-containing protein [Cesiribacter sp. SM1]|uniref:transporter substrate-binding domain-containing protein n=1 Tax=Cesiribacter sp. SM1 TaxID=2861196 RepID=UPI001CD416A8|nr:transporter substrate-binding domain-containing protein [Cesiribacter sp. SM1]
MFSATAYGQSDTTAGAQFKRELIIGLHPQPPYIIKGENGTWDGISIRLWRAVAENLKITYRYMEIAPDDAPAALQQGKIDLLLQGDVTAEADALIDFSHFYHTAEMGVATAKFGGISSITKAFFNKRFWVITAMLSVLLLIVGSIIYLVERGQNEDHFGGDRSILEGIGSGFWWAGVTMTTIGYGDKAPVTPLGRAVALLWMLVAMAVTAVLTASLVSVVMGSSGKDQVKVPGDLRDMEVAAVEGSGAARYLEQERISYQKFQDLQEALHAVNKNELDAVLHNVPVLRYTINNSSSLRLQVQAVGIDPHYFALGFKEDSPLREPLNHALLRIINTPLWQQELDRFIPDIE